MNGRGDDDDDNDDDETQPPLTSTSDAIPVDEPPIEREQSGRTGAIPRLPTPRSARMERSDFALPRAARVVVKEGETLEDVADEYGTSVTALLRANPQVRDARDIFAGEEIRLPTLGRPTATPSPAASTPPIAATGSSPGFFVPRPPPDPREQRARDKKEAARDVARAVGRTISRTTSASFAGVGDDVDVKPPRYEDVAAGRARFVPGHEGPAIRALQERLNGAGYRLTETARYGATMQLVVKQLQREHGLTETGAIGPATLDALGRAELQAVRDYRMSLRPHAEGAAVRHVQQLLGITQSDVFDATTEEAVRAFQAARGLLVDGIVGIRTLAALEGASAAATLRREPGAQASAPRVDHNAFAHPRAWALSHVAVALMARVQQGHDRALNDDIVRAAIEILDVTDPRESLGLVATGHRLARYLNEHGIAARLSTQGRIDDLVLALQRGIAVPVGVESFGGTVTALDARSERYPSLRPGESYAHRFGTMGLWVLVTGFKGEPQNPRAFVANDPDSGATVEISRREFERHTGEGIGLVVVLPHDELLG